MVTYCLHLLLIFFIMPPIPGDVNSLLPQTALLLLPASSWNRNIIIHSLLLPKSLEGQIESIVEMLPTFFKNKTKQKNILTTFNLRLYLASMTFFFFSHVVQPLYCNQNFFTFAFYFFLLVLLSLFFFHVAFTHEIKIKINSVQWL